MKTTRLIAVLLAAALCMALFFGCGGKTIGKAKAKEIALADAGVAEKDIRDFDCELDKEAIGKTAYEIEFEVGFDEYEYKIDAETGEILKAKVD